MKALKAPLLILSCLFCAACLGLFSATAAAQKGDFVSVDELRQQAFPNEKDLPWQTLWVTQVQRAAIEKILNRRFTALRIRYWGSGNRSTWIFSEIGKELPITLGVIVENSQIVDVVVMSYRESRGGEVRYPFFTHQFRGLELFPSNAKGPADTADKGYSNTLFKLSDSIDGITGATLSVRALKKIATLALFCHQLTPFANDTTANIQASDTADFSRANK
jgi:hypothetical protein